VKRLARRAVTRVLDLAEERQRALQQTSPATKAALRTLVLRYRELDAAGTLPPVWETGLRVFSQFDEDGVLLFLLAAGGLKTQRFVDIGAGDGVWASNTANLALNLGFHGLFVEARTPEIERGRAFYARHPDSKERPPVFAQSFVTRENVDGLVRDAGLDGEIDVLSIDIDGNDYWIWDALTAASPRLVVVEAHTELGLEDVVAPYEASFDWRTAAPGAPLGASPAAFVKLADRLGYRLVGANLYGFNLFFARADVVPQLPAIAVAEVFRHGSYPAELRDAAAAAAHP
jgi:hypothetical protein